MSDSPEDLEMYPEHPLFPFPDDEQGFDVSFISVTRYEGVSQIWGPCYPASELQSEQEIIERHGGGKYVLVARKPNRNDKTKPGAFTKTRKLNLPGRPIPFSNDPTPEEERAADPSKHPLPTQQQGMNMGGGFENIFMAMMTMQGQAAERLAAENRAAQQREAESSKNFMTMLVTLMSGSKADTQNMMQMMMTLSSQQQTAMMQMMGTLMGSRGGGPEEMAKFAELFKTLGFAQPSNGAAKPDGEGGIGQMLSDVADIAHAVVTMKGGPPNPALGPSEPAPPGSAQEILERIKRGNQ